tara:strand:+ start:5334 stop:5912 length:579 start_codon:yes stop_codon:yes gene_type:complete
MAVNFTPLLKRLAAKGVKPNTPAARNWFRTKVRSTRVNRQKLMSASDRLEARPQIGSMYCYAYDPKWKKKLEYYDEFPLIFVVEPSPGGFIGINLHYVSPRNRIILMDSLTKISTDKNYNKKTKLALSYNILKGLSKYNMIKPCLKRYLYGQVKSNFVKIDANEWDIAIFLPVQKFRKAAASTVWSESARNS